MPTRAKLSEAELGWALRVDTRGGWGGVLCSHMGTWRYNDHGDHSENTTGTHTLPWVPLLPGAWGESQNEQGVGPRRRARMRPGRARVGDGHPRQRWGL